MIKELLLASCLLGASTAVFAGKAKAPPAAQAVDAEFEQGRATAKADFAAGRPGWYFFFYSNMPNGPDDPVQARERDLFIALLEEKGIRPMNSSTGCIPDTAFPRFTQGYNMVAEPLLKEKFGSDYLRLFKEEVARRMKAAPQPAG
jgi:hypothetical protein